MRVPLLVEAAELDVVCVGGGPVAAAKVVPLAAAGAAVRVIAPECVAELADVARWERRAYREGDVRTGGRTVLVVAATGVADVDHAVAAAAAAAGLACLRIDGAGPVSLPSVVRDGGLVLALATGAPALTKRLRQELAAGLDPRWGRAAEGLAALREDPDVRAALARLAPAERRRRWRAAVEAALGADPGRARAALLGR